MPNKPSPYNKQQLERFAETTVGALKTPMVVVDEQLKVVAASPAFCRLLAGVVEPRGQELLSLVDGRWDFPELRQALEVILPQRRSFDDVRIPGAGGDDLFVSGRALHADDNQPVLITLSFDLEKIQARTTVSLEEFSLTEEIVATVREPMLVLDYEYRVKLANQSFYRTFRVSPKDVVGRPLAELGMRQWDVPALRRQLETVLKQDRSFNDFEVEHDFPEIGRRTMLLNARRIDHLQLILLAIEDVTERRLLERQQEMLISELAHRVHNLLAVIQSLASQTGGRSVEDYRSAFLGRLRAFAAAHGVLFQTRWREAELGDVLQQILAPHIEADADRVRMKGPAVSLSAERTTALALIIHELATNAAKYGSLSTSSGHVVVSWGLVSDTVRLEWHESGGPPVDPAPSASFGTTLIEQATSYQLRGHSELKFRSSGLVCSLEFSLTD